MPHYLELNGDVAYFVADAHFRGRSDPGEAQRRELFIRFLRSLPPDSILFLLGDIFDFYFEYRWVVARRFLDLYLAFLDCRSRGVRMHFVGGNHDHWVGDFVVEDLGITVHETEITAAVQGRKIVCAHGDLLMPRDAGYKVLKSIIRNSCVVAVSRWIHPDIMEVMARAVSTTSRRFSRAVQEKRALMMADLAHRDFFRRGNDVFVMGHVHYPLHDARDGQDFLIVGDWVKDFTYGRLREGKLSLERFKG